MSSRQIMQALIAGERDPVVLAQMAKSRMRAKIPQLEEALSGRFGAHPAVVCRQVTNHIEFLDRSIAALTDEITARLAPFEAAVALITSLPGISGTTAEVIVAETGAGMSRFGTDQTALATAVGGCAGPRRSGTRRGAHQGHLLLGAVSAYRPRRGPNKAAVAVANSMLATIWHLLTTRKLYQDLGADYFERRHDPALEARRLARKIEALGFTVTVTRRLKSDNITSQLLAPPL